MYVGRRAPSGRRGAFQEWRSRVTGRVTEVDEANVYAPAEELRPGAEGFLEYRDGVPVVQRRPGGRAGRPGHATRRPAPGAASAPRRVPRRPRVAPSVWILIGLLAIVIALAWIR